MLDFLKGGKVTLTVTVDRGLRVYNPGETVKATVTLESARELKIRAGHVAFVCQEDYKYGYETTDSDGNRSTSAIWGQTKHPVDQRDFLGETVFPANTHQTYDFTFLIPAAAPPTGSGSIYRLKWIVEVKLDRKLAGDMRGEAEVAVVSTPPGQLVTPGEYGQSSEPGEAELAFFLPSKEWVLGQTITGELRIHPHKEFTANEIRVELVRHEYVSVEDGNSADTVAVKAKLAGKTQLRAGQPQIFPIQVPIPADAVPSMEGEEGVIMWHLKGILSRTLRSDTCIEGEVMVYTGGPG
ncbi:MAG: sporulation protein [Chloroflexi bacterium]|nr:sporulation protein [Chloroflexota bacterium]